MNEKINNILSEYSKVVVLHTKKINNLPQYTEITLSDIEKLKNPNKFSSMSKIWFDIADKIIDQVDIKDLYIDVNKNDVESLKFFREKSLDNRSTSEMVSDYISGNVYMNDLYADKVCLNIKSLMFTSFYPHILIKLVDNDILKMNEKYYTVFKYIFTKRNELENRIVTKMFINYFYGIISGESRPDQKNNKINCGKLFNFEYYKLFLYNKIKAQLKNDLIYLDVDKFYYKGDHQFNFDLPYEIENVDEFVIFKKKKFIEKINNNTKYKGFKFV